MNLFRSVSIRLRLFFLLLLSVAGLGIMGLLGLRALREQAMAGESAATQRVVELAHGVIESQHARQLSGELDEAEAQTAALEQLRSLRYAGDNYVWVHGGDLRMKMHPFKPALEGEDLAGFADPNGVRLFVEMNRVVARDGKGFVHYHWPMPGHDDPVAKVSYVTAFEPWDWVLGSGAYLDQVEAKVQAATRHFIGAGSIVAGIMATIAFLVSLSIARPIQAIARAMRGLAAGQGDLTLRLPSCGNDEATQLARGFNDFVELVRDIVERVHAAVAALASACDELSGSAVLQARGSSHQLQLAQSVATAMTELAATAGSVSQNAQSAAHAAEEANRSSSEGQNVVRRNVQSFEELGADIAQLSEATSCVENASQRIGSVLQVISSIAEQTNLLALNATIEAARAGEAGRGFSVVAEEVRSLAARTQESVGEIERTISDLRSSSDHASTLAARSHERAEQTLAAAHASGAAFEQIAAAVHRISDMTGQIADAAAEQSSVASMMDRDISEIRAETMTSATASEETEASTRALVQLADGLSELVGRFKV